MKIIKIFFLIIVFYSSVFAQFEDDEITLYDIEGAPIAYISIEEDYTIYTWGGEPVSYLEKTGSDISIYNFDGEHLGWFDDGVLIDHNGDIVGFQEGAISKITQIESIKSIKSLRSIKSIEEIPPITPVASNYWSKIPLELFLIESISDPKQIIIDNIDGDFEGFEGDTVLKLINGQIWQQSEYHYEYTYEYMPKVIVYKKKRGFKIKVEGIDEPVSVIRLK